MRTLVHMSDLHFRWVDPELLGPLTQQLHELAPDLIVISGDLTQRALRSEFHAAKKFLDGLPQPQMVVPGNHDVPMINVFSRFVRPLHSYRSIITEDLQPFFEDDEIAVVGVNTARSLTIKNGRINEEQMEHVRAVLGPIDDRKAKIVVTHHPFDLPMEADQDDLVGRAQRAMNVFALCKVDLLLAGHMHSKHAGCTSKRYAIGDHAALSIQAGTATSTRTRGEVQSFNIIRVGGTTVSIDHMAWRAEGKIFECVETETYLHSEQGWSPLESNVGTDSDPGSVRLAGM